MTAEVVMAYCVLKKAVDYFRKAVHILYIDGCHCTDGWKILLCSFMDCNHSIQPIGFELCQGESNTSWVTFLTALSEAGVGKVKDLVIYSDRNESILTAVNEVFPDAEWVPCAVHLNRNLQQKWTACHGDLSRSNHDNVVDFNQFVQYYWKACISETEEEKNEWLHRMEDFERDLDAGKTEEKKCGCYKFLEQFPEMFMCDWKFNHMMMRSSNPIESCMSVLLRNFNGKGEVREATFFNRYRSLVQWMLQCVEKRRNWTYTAKLCVPVEPRKKEEIICPWAVKEVIRRGHYAVFYEEKLKVTPCHKNGRELTDSKGSCLIL